MRRTDRQITDKSVIVDIIDECPCCRIGMNDEDGAYIVPLSFGYDNKCDKLCLYFHSAKDGKKIKMLKNNCKVGFEMDTALSLVPGNTACNYSYSYKCVMGKGTVRFIENKDEILYALNKIIGHYTSKTNLQFDRSAIESVCVFELNVEQITCKAH